MTDAAQALAEVEREYHALSTKVIYARFSKSVDPEDEQRMEELGRKLVELSAPRFRETA